MVAVKAGDVERALRTRRSEIRLLLVYGPDAGRVSETARKAAEAEVDDASDPFSIVRLDGETLADDPARLIDEASTFSLFGGRRTIWVRPSSRAVAPAVSAFLEFATPESALVVVEAGELAKSSPLRVACERSPAALALPHYGDEAKDLRAIVTEALAAEGLTIDPDARTLLVEHLGGDRLASRGELAKLALYAHGRGRVSVEDVEAAVSDVSALGIDQVLDAAFLGRADALGSGLVQLGSLGVGPPAILALALRHGLSLLAGRAAMDEGGDPDSALRAWRGLNYRRREAVLQQLRDWSGGRLETAVAGLQQATLDSRRSPNLAAARVAAELFRVATLARRSAA